MPSKKDIPLHALETSGSVVLVQDVGHKNPYDYTKPHRHLYFELFLVETGGGSQWIDFDNIPMLGYSCYIVFPQQIHLMKRDENTRGLVVQFSESSIPSDAIKLFLGEMMHSESPSVVFQEDFSKYSVLRQTIITLQVNISQQRKFFNEINLLLLQQLLLQVLELNKLPEASPSENSDEVFHQFIQLLEEQFTFNHSVKKYVELLNTTDKKLTDLTKKHLGNTPLQVIHNRIILEVKRLLGFDGISHKQVAYQLGFDNPMRFSQFIKSKTGISPSELQQQLLKMNK